MIDKRRLVSNATFSVVNAVISGLVLFILYRYLLAQLGSVQLGLWSVVLASTSVARLSDMGLTGSVVKFVARYRAVNDDKQAADVVQTASISIALVMAILCISVYPWLNSLLALAVPANSMQLASSILPWAVFSLWLGSVGGVFQSGLDGCQRMDIRNILMIVCNILFLFFVIWLVPHFGLVGLAIGQVLQGTLIMLVSWLLLRKQLSMLPRVPVNFSKEKFKEMFSYSVNFQINSIAIMLFDPAIKLLMSRYGGLSSTAYYEMANQFVIKLRALIIAANQAVVPAVAALHQTAPEQVSNAYLQAYRIVFFVAIPFYTAIWISLPIVSELWIGYIEDQFLMFGWILIVGWGVNNLLAPAYFTNLGTGDLRWNSISHVFMAVSNVVLGITLGKIFGALGVALGAMIAQVVASLFLQYIIHKQYKISLSMILPREHYGLISAVVTSIILSTMIHRLDFFEHRIHLMSVCNISIFLILVGYAVWFHPYKTVLLNRILSRK